MRSARYPSYLIFDLFIYLSQDLPRNINVFTLKCELELPSTAFFTILHSFVVH